MTPASGTFDRSWETNNDDRVLTRKAAPGRWVGRQYTHIYIYINSTAEGEEREPPVNHGKGDRREERKNISCRCQQREKTVQTVNRETMGFAKTSLLSVWVAITEKDGRVSVSTIRRMAQVTEDGIRKMAQVNEEGIRMAEVSLENIGMT